MGKTLDGTVQTFWLKKVATITSSEGMEGCSITHCGKLGKDSIHYAKSLGKTNLAPCLHAMPSIYVCDRTNPDAIEAVHHIINNLNSIESAHFKILE